MTLAAASRLGPYEILSPLGAGGMGEVYRARDTKLKRDVAIKVLPQSLAADPDALARFEREAMAVAALSHPNILAIHDFGSEDGVAYAVMELLEGETLRDKLSAGPIPQKRAVDYALQVVKGLSAAHEKGIVHRDLKPENLFVSKDGHLKILDFGLAKRVEAVAPGEVTEASTVSGHTEPGTVMGTVGYMSPEQVRGLPVDHRSDIFSFGAILYELLSGKKAFSRPTVADTMSAIMKEEPPELSKSGGNISLALDHIVRHCLEKDRDNRFQSARDIAFDLSEQSSQSVTSGAQIVVAPTGKRNLLIAAAAIAVLAVAGVLLLRRPQKVAVDAGGVKRVAVLPFENLGSPEDDYFASGMTEEITSRLANVRSLAVISRTTATQYDRKGKTVEQIGKDLGVGYVLEGSVRWDRSSAGPGRVRITPQLIRVADDTHLWSERYDRQLADIFAIQGDVADGVVRALNITLAPAESKSLRQLPTKDLEAYDFYLRALELWKRNQERSVIAQQIRLTSAAVERDPEFAEALALLAYARLRNYWLYYDRRESELERARVEAGRAVALRPDSAETHLALGYYYYMGRLDYEAALAEFGKALALQPNEARVHEAISYIRRRQGKLEEAEAELQKVVGSDPKNSNIYEELGHTQLLLRKYPEAIRNLEISTLLEPKFSDAYAIQAWAHLLWRGDTAAANHVLQSAAGIRELEDPAGALDYFSLRTALLARDWKKALEIVDKPQPDVLSQHWFLPRSLLRAEVQSYTGHQDLARASYEEARQSMVPKIGEESEDARFHSSLGIALAGLGRTAEAVQEGERGVELMPPTRDALRGISRVEDLARIYTMVGNQDAAIHQLDFLLSHPSLTSATVLKLDPRWDPLRKNPKFEALLAKYEVKP